MLSAAPARAPRAVLLLCCLAALAACALILPAASPAASPFGPLAGPVPTSGPTCDNSWKTGVAGDWFNAANWSAGHVPTSTENACIKVNGTYTVTQTQTFAGVTVASLQIGAASGTQTLAIGSTCSAHATFTTTSGTTVGGHGALTLTNGDGCGDNVTLVGAVTNAGTVTSVPANGGQRSIQGNFTNTGTLAINTSTGFNAAGATLDNQGAVNVAATLAVSGAATTFTNDTGGSITPSSGGLVSTGSGTVFNQGAGTTAASTQPVLLDDTALNYTGTGASFIRSRGTSGTLSGNIASGQTLQLESTCGEHNTTTASASFTNAGTIEMTNGDGCSDNVTLVVSSGTLTNTGTIQVDAPIGGARTIQGNLTNQGGSLNVNTPTTYSGAGTLDNQGAVNVANAETLSVSGAGTTFTNDTGGSITPTGTGLVSTGSGTVFNQGAGTTAAGTRPVLLDDTALNYTGTGASFIRSRGTSGTLSGNIASGQTLQLESTCSENDTTTASASFTNAGTIEMTNGDGCSDTVTFVVSSGTLTNTGTIQVDAPIGGARTIQGNLTNQGTVNLNTATTYNNAGSFDNQGAVNLPDGVQLTVSGGGTAFTNDTGGSVNATGTNQTGDLFASATTFTQGAGTETGVQPVIVDDGTLTYTGTGKGPIHVRGTTSLSGNTATGQRLQIESTCSENATVTAAGSFTNGGTIEMTNADGCADSDTLTVSSGTLTNTGKIQTDAPIGGTRNIQGNVLNKGFLVINRSTSDSVSGATLTQSGGTLTIANHQSLAMTSAPVVNNTSGTIVGAGVGVLRLTGGTFNQGAGTTSGTTPASKPVIVDNGAVHYTGTGASQIAVQGTGTLSGNLASGQQLFVEDTCSENTTITAAASFSSAGTILLRSLGCSDVATLEMAGLTLTNSGTLGTSKVGVNGTQRVDGSVVNNGTVAVGASRTLTFTGTYQQGSGGTYQPKMASTSGHLTVNGSATLAGTLAITRSSTYKPAAGTSVNVLTAGSVIGTFGTVTGAAIVPASGTYFLPQYTATAVNLVVHQATLTLVPNSGAAGSGFNATGSDWPPSTNVTFVFTDHHGTKTTLTSSPADGSGAFNVPLTVPASAVLGDGKVTATSDYSSLAVSSTFTVTP